MSFEFFQGFPGGFQGFPGGFPNGFRGAQSRSKPQGDTTKLYTSLGVDKKATKSEIKRAFRNLAKIHHPDRGGDAEKFKEIQKAYEVLGDPSKRAVYDRTGDEKCSPRRKVKGKSTVMELKVPLEQFFRGHERKIRVSRSVICNSCNGEGGTDVSVCSNCSGQGIEVVVRRLGGGMIQQSQRPCSSCDGKGRVIPLNKRCNGCRGRGLKRSKKVLTVHIQKGMKSGEKIVFSEEGDQSPDPEYIPGDVIVVLRPAKHPVFTRSPDGCHLVVKKKISLLESLTGFQFSLNHLDGRALKVFSQENVIYKPGTIQAIRNEGMPLRGDIFTRGHIFVEFEVEFPTHLSRTERKAFTTLLGPTTPLQDAKRSELMSDEEEVTLDTVDVSVERARYAKLMANDAPEHEEDEDPHFTRVDGCQMQ